jgi:hypothetical protein
MNQFSPKSLAFYGITIVAVIILFSAVSAFGESNLKAPPKIEGHYRVTRSSLPDCLPPDTVNLNVHQSGIYLTASFSPTVPKNAPTQAIAPSAAVEKNTTLTGHWHAPTLVLKGQVFPHNFHRNGDQVESKSPTCSGQGQTVANLTATVQQKVLQGTLALGSPSVKIVFWAEKQPDIQKVPDH